jgi:flagellar basal body-associated protein FliL
MEEEKPSVSKETIIIILVILLILGLGSSVWYFAVQNYSLRTKQAQQQFDDAKDKVE